MRNKKIRTISISKLKTLATNILFNGYSFRFQARGYSMHPFIKDGDYLVVKPVDHLKVGDIVLYSSLPGKLTVHRINKIGNGFIITKGDSASWQDCPIKKEAILGKVVMIERRKQKRNLERGVWKLINFTCVITNPFLLRFRSVVRRVSAHRN